MPPPVFSFNLNDFVLVWLSLLYEALPFIAVGAVVSGIIAACVSRELIARLLPGNRFVALCLSAVLGLAFPVCECGIIPVIRRLVAKGVPVSCAVTYMLAAPIINPVVIAGTLLAFRGQGFVGVALVRAVLGFVIAVSIGLIIWKLVGEGELLLPGLEPTGAEADRAAEDGEPQDGHGHHRAPGPRSSGQVIESVFSYATHDFLEIATYLVLGSALAAVINSGFHRSAIQPFAENPFLSVGGMMLLAVLLNLCSEADAFVAASFYAFSLPAKVAFLVLGPMLDIKLVLMYTRLFRGRAIALIVSLVVAFVFLLCVTGQQWIPSLVNALPK
jgi:uncharacterized membrane protein YraQ (UPF0718 family)